MLNDFSFSSRNTKNVYPYGQKLQLKCNKGYELKGEPFLQCLESGWSHNVSSCSSIVDLYTVKLLFYGNSI